MFSIVLSSMLTSCSLLVSSPIEPRILGVGYLHYDIPSDRCYAVIDSVQYTITEISVPNHGPQSHSKMENMHLADGMIVTAFTSRHLTGVQAVIGDQTADQIEGLYHEDYTGIFAFCGLLLFCMIGISVPKKARE